MWLCSVLRLFFSDSHKVCSEFLVLIFIVCDIQEVVYLYWMFCIVWYWRRCTMWYAVLVITCRGLYAGEAQQCPACSRNSWKRSSQHSHHVLHRCSVLYVTVSLQEWIISRFCCPLIEALTAIAIFHYHNFSMVIFLTLVTLASNCVNGSFLHVS